MQQNLSSLAYVHRSPQALLEMPEHESPPMNFPGLTSSMESSFSDVLQKVEVIVALVGTFLKKKLLSSCFLGKKLPNLTKAIKKRSESSKNKRNYF
jgi:hypothetical protein